MIPPRAAREIAAAAQMTSTGKTFPRLSAIIASGTPLQTGDVDLLREFWSLNDGSPEFLKTAALLGGKPMMRAAATVEEAQGKPAPEGHNSGMIAVRIDQAEQLVVDDGLPVEEIHVTLAYLGPVEEMNPVAVVEAKAIAADFAASHPPISGRLTHVAHLGGPDIRELGLVAVVYEVTSPELHVFRLKLVEELRAAGIDWSNRFAFRPHVTLTYIDEAEAEEAWPEGEIDPIDVTFGSIDAVFAGETRESPFAAAQITAAAIPAVPRYQRLSDHLDALNSSLVALDNAATVEIRTAIELGWRSAMDRVGRMVTRQASGDRRMRPPQAAVTASAEELEAVNPGQLIAPAVSDTVAHVAGVILRTQNETEALIAEAFEVDLSDLWPDPTVAVSWLVDRMTDEILFRLGVLSDIGRIDPTDGEADPLLVPFQIIRDLMALAGGAPLDGDRPARDEIGRPVSSEGKVSFDGIGCGPAAQQAIDDSILSWADSIQSVTADAQRTGALISPELSAELAEAAAAMQPGATDPVERITVHTWRINMNGRAQVNLPAHKVMDGTVAVSPNDLYAIPDALADVTEWPFTGHRYPGDHAYCHCGWEARQQIVSVLAQRLWPDGSPRPEPGEELPVPEVVFPPPAAETPIFDGSRERLDVSTLTNIEEILGNRLDLIDQFIEDPDLFKIAAETNVYFERQKKKGLNGTFSYRNFDFDDTGSPLEFRPSTDITLYYDPEKPINPEAIALTFIHEMGHRFDFNPILVEDPEGRFNGALTHQVGDYFSTEQALSNNEDPELDAMREFFDVAYESLGHVQRQKILQPAEKAYLLDPPEVWARAFTQWIVRRSDDDALKAEMAREYDNFGGFYRQWEDPEIMDTETDKFGVLDEAITEVLRSKGVLL